jgi:ParB family transcriptional regulator, chromosome partitioning protein
MERRLGRGLGSLLGESIGADTLEPSASTGGGLLQVELGRIRPNPFQPRKAMDPAGLEELRDSIRAHGILQPIVLRAAGSDYELISGERRWRAARLAGLERIPALVRDGVSNHEMLELALVENVQRRDLNPIERALGFRSIMDSLGITQEAAAAKVGLKRSTVANHLRLLELSPKVQEAVSSGLITMGHARALLGLQSIRDMEAVLADIVHKELSVRDVERIVRGKLATIRSPGSEAHAASANGSMATERKPWVGDLERRMREHLGTKATIQPGAGAAGRIVIEYYTRDSLDRLCELLAPRVTV